MKVKCINNTGKFLRTYEYDYISNNNVSGRFGTTGNTEYDEITVDCEYIVMGILIFRNYQAYLIDDDGFISACPCQLFEIVDNNIPINWKFRLIGKDEDIYPFVQALMGYPELCSDKKVYENLIIEKEEESERIYFRRKTELENSFS